MNIDRGLVLTRCSALSVEEKYIVYSLSDGKPVSFYSVEDVIANLACNQFIFDSCIYTLKILESNSEYEISDFLADEPLSDNSWSNLQKDIANKIQVQSGLLLFESTIAVSQDYFGDTDVEFDLSLLGKIDISQLEKLL